jgi:hypothetical protein
MYDELEQSGGERLWLISRYCRSISEERLRKTAKQLVQGSMSHLELNKVLSK